MAKRHKKNIIKNKKKLINKLALGSKKNTLNFHQLS